MVRNFFGVKGINYSKNIKRKKRERKEEEDTPSICPPFCFNQVEKRGFTI